MLNILSRLMREVGIFDKFLTAKVAVQQSIELMY